jgi:hypothetical protein
MIMKKTILSLLLLSLYVSSYALTDKIRLGINFAPGVGWFRAEGKDLNRGAAAYAMHYGLYVEYYFKDQNYAFITGLMGGMDGGGIRERDTLMALNSSKTSISESYRNQYIGIPIGLKLKTNAYKKFRGYGQLGFMPVFNLSTRASFDQPVQPTGGGAPVLIDQENILRSSNDVQRLIPGFRYNVFDLRLMVGGGAEYDISDKTSAFFGVFYYNGFFNAIDDSGTDAKAEPILMRNVVFSMGIMF